MGAPVLLRNASDAYVSEKYPSRNYNSAARIYLADGSAANTRFGYIFFGVPSGMTGTTIISAKLRLYSGAGFAGAVTLSIQRLASKFSVNRVNWNNKPGVTGAIKQVSKTDAAAGTMWEFDVQDVMQQVASGLPWYGFRISVTGSSAKWLHSAQAASQYRPVLEITWSDAPDQPEVLVPDHGVSVSVAKPTLKWDFVDPAGDQTMQSFYLRLFSTEALADANAPGNLLDLQHPSTVPLFDLDDPAAAAYAGLAEAGTLWWRVQNVDGAGIPSAWSEPAYFTRTSKGTLAITNPAANGKELRRNLVPNPSAEVDAAGWNASGWTAPVRSTTRSKVGAASFMIDRATASGVGLALYTDPHIDTVVGQTYSGQIAVFATAAIQARATIQWDNAAGSAVISYSQGPLVTLAANTWTVLKVEGAVCPAGGGKTRLELELDTPGGVTVYADAAMLEAAPTAGTYFDGDTADNYENEYVWTGAAGSSPSIQQGLPYIEEATPPFSWTFTGRTQEAYEVLLSTPEEPERYLWRSGVVNSLDTAVTPPPGKITETGKTYRLKVRIYDTVNRASLPDDPVYVEAARDFVFDLSSAVTPVSDLTGTADVYRSRMTLDWTRATAPDYFVLIRDGKVVGEYEPSDLLVGGTSYRLKDDEAKPRKDTTWSIAAKVNGATSSANPTVTGRVKPITTTLSETDDDRTIFLFEPNVAAEKTESSEIHYLLGNAPPVLISQSLRGYEGTVSGVLLNDTVPGMTAAGQLSSLNFFKERPGVVLKLVWVDKVMRVVIRNVTDEPIAYPDGTVEYLVSFEFFQVDF